MLEVAKPATQDGVEVLNDSLQAVATGTPRLVADNVLQSRKTFPSSCINIHADRQERA